MQDLLTRSRAMVAAETEYNAARKALHDGIDPEAKPRFVKAQRAYTEAIDAMGQVEDIARELVPAPDAAPRRHVVQTASGRFVDLYDPRPETIVWEDVALALGAQARFNGHTRRFYSVAEHSVRVSFCVPEEDALWGLIHDAAEAYIGDIVSPVKRLCPELYVVERALLNVICDKLGLPHDMPESMLEADERMLATEAHQLLTGDISWCKAEPYPCDLERIWVPMSPADAYGAWKLRLQELTGGRHG